MTAADTTRVALQLETAFGAGPEEAQATLRALYADAVELRHVPALPSDGIVDGSLLREASGREAAAIRNAIPDYDYDDVQVEVNGDCVHVMAWIRGTLTTGRPVRLLADMQCTVRDGRIIAMSHLMDNDTMAAWADVAAAGGIDVPDKLRDEASGK